MNTANNKDNKALKNRIAYFVLLPIIVILSLTLVYLKLFDNGNPSSHATSNKTCSKKLSKEVLKRSLELGTQFLLNNQKAEGNFYYQYDWIAKTDASGDNQVRQAGALWGLVLINQYYPSDKVRAAAEKAFEFFNGHSKTTDSGSRYIIYPGAKVGFMGTVALTTLAHIDFLRSEWDKLERHKRNSYVNFLNQYIKFLVAARRPDGRWYKYYDLSNGQPFGKASPYFDGEALLALIKAAKYLNRRDLLRDIIESAEKGYLYNVSEALSDNPDSPITKGYYQWASMAYHELYSMGLEETDKYGLYLLYLADWMIDVHKTLKRTRNTAYAYEGIILAYNMANKQGDTEHAEKFRCVIEQGLEKLTSWQVGSPIANEFISSKSTSDKRAIGGIQNHAHEPALRIDVAQHQMHAVMLALKYLYSSEN